MKKPRTKKPDTVSYLTRSMPRATRDTLKLIAKQREQTMEDLVNNILGGYLDVFAPVILAMMPTKPTMPTMPTKPTKLPLVPIFAKPPSFYPPLYIPTRSECWDEKQPWGKGVPCLVAKPGAVGTVVATKGRRSVTIRIPPKVRAWDAKKEG